MLSRNINRYIISEPSEIDSLKSALNRSFAGLKESLEKTRFEIYDTFDWRLHKNDRQLVRRGNQFDLIQVAEEKVISSIDTGGKREIRFCWDFPASDFADFLEPLLEMRALMPVAEFERNIDRLAICNADNKTAFKTLFA